MTSILPGVSLLGGWVVSTFDSLYFLLLPCFLGLLFLVLPLGFFSGFLMSDSSLEMGSNSHSGPYLPGCCLVLLRHLEQRLDRLFVPTISGIEVCRKNIEETQRTSDHGLFTWTDWTSLYDEHKTKSPKSGALCYLYPPLT